MIEAFSLKNAHYFGDALASQARLRYRVFIQQRGLDHAHYDRMEYDEFDTPAAVYLVWRDQAQVVRGLMRCVPTSVPYMLERYCRNFASRAVSRRVTKCGNQAASASTGPMIRTFANASCRNSCARFRSS